jgi:hypothetical protein
MLRNKAEFDQSLISIMEQIAEIIEPGKLEIDRNVKSLDEKKIKPSLILNRKKQITEITEL